MTQLRHVVEPFGEVNIYPVSNTTNRITATILMEPHKEGSQTGIALDGSGSMASQYYGNPNQITPVAQELCHYLASKVDADGGTTCIYWALGNGHDIEVVGDFTADQAKSHLFTSPSRGFGQGTCLLPAIKYFDERFKDAPWGIYVFITDGNLDDLYLVKEYSRELSRRIYNNDRNPLKFVLIGVGTSINSDQLQELDDLNTEIDLWDHKIASEMRFVQEIFAEVVDKNSIVAPLACVYAPNGDIIKNYHEGLPAYLEFEVPSSIPYFMLHFQDNKIYQPLQDGIVCPTNQVNPENNYRQSQSSQTVTHQDPNADSFDVTETIRTVKYGVL